MQRLIGVAAMVMAGCLNPVSDVPDSARPEVRDAGYEHRLLGRPPSAHFNHWHWSTWNYVSTSQFGFFGVSQIHELENGDVLLDPIDGAFLADGGYRAPSTSWTQPFAQGSEPDNRWLHHPQGIFSVKILDGYFSPLRTLIGRLDDSTRELRPSVEFAHSWDGGGILLPPKVHVSAFPESGHVWVATLSTNGSCVTPTSVRRSFDGAPILSLNDCFFAVGEVVDGDSSIVLGRDGRIGRVSANSVDVEPTSRGACKQAFEGPAGVMDLACQTQFLVPKVTVVRASATSTTEITTFTLPDGHVLVALIRSEPRLIITGTKEDGGFAVHACNAVECARLVETTTWPPMIGLTDEALSVAHYEPDAGVFMWRHQRSTLGL